MDPKWPTVERVVHTCKLNGDVVFDDMVTEANRCDGELWQGKCNHIAGLVTQFYYRGALVPTKEGGKVERALRKRDRNQNYPDKLGEIKTNHRVTLWRLNQEHIDRWPSEYEPAAKNMRLNKTFCKMEPTVALQVQNPADSAEEVPLKTNRNWQASK